MIDFEKAKNTFNRYVEKFDKNDSRVDRKIRHTYLVVEASEYLSRALKLSEEDAELSKLIALLHDIGRFKQSEIKEKNYDQIEENFDHAEYGVNLLFKDNFIREFIEESQYDEIIYKAIKNHNKLEIEYGLSEKELLHAKLIRDNDKTGNFTLKVEEDLKEVYNLKNISEIEYDEISDDTYNSFMSAEVIKRMERKTNLDSWISLVAFIFDYNFKESLEYIYNNQYINKIFDKISYKNPKTIEKILKMKKFSLMYIQEQIAK